MQTPPVQCTKCLGDGHLDKDQIEGEPIVPCPICAGYGQITYDIAPKIVQGDLLQLFDDGHFDIIYPGGNHCFCRPEQGLAGKVTARWPEYHAADLANGRRGDRKKLGTNIAVSVKRTCDLPENGIIMLSYTQFMYGRYNDPTDLFSLSAVHAIFKTMCSVYAPHYRVGIARIGGELGNADSEAVQMLLELEMMREFKRSGKMGDITIVEFQK